MAQRRLPSARPHARPAGLQVHCPGTSVAYADGTAECELPGCTLPHDLHEWVATAADLEHSSSSTVDVLADAA